MKKDSAHINSSVDNCKVIQLNVYPDINGKLAVIENGQRLPFAMKRLFFLFDVPWGAERGGHSHFEEEELIIAVTGAFEVDIDDGIHKRTILLNRPDEGLYITPGIWRELRNFTSGAVCVVLASTNFSEADYVRNYNDFLFLTSPKHET